jgi:hypothetical protein
MSKLSQFGLGVGVGIFGAGALGLVMGQGSARGTEPVAGVTSYDEDGYHVAVAWSRSGDRLLPVARGAVIHTQRSETLVDEQNIGHIAIRSDPATFAKDDAKQKQLLQLLDGAEHDSNIVHVREAYTKAMRLIAEQNVCPTCQDAFEDLSTSCPDIACVSTVFDRYIVCVRAHCR